MLAIDLKPELEKLLSQLAEKSGSTGTDVARQAIIERIEDLEDYYDAVEADQEGGPYFTPHEARHELRL